MNFTHIGWWHLLQHLVLRFFLHLRHFTRFSRTWTSSPSNGYNVALARCPAARSVTCCKRKCILYCLELLAILKTVWDLILITSSMLQKTWNCHLQLPGLVEYSRHIGPPCLHLLWWNDKKNYTRFPGTVLAEVWLQVMYGGQDIYYLGLLHLTWE